MLRIVQPKALNAIKMNNTNNNDTIINFLESVFLQLIIQQVRKLMCWIYS